MDTLGHIVSGIMARNQWTNYTAREIIVGSSDWTSLGKTTSDGIYVLRKFESNQYATALPAGQWKITGVKGQIVLDKTTTAVRMDGVNTYLSSDFVLELGNSFTVVESSAPVTHYTHIILLHLEKL